MNRLSEEQFPSFGMQHPLRPTGHGIPKTLPPLVRIHPFMKINRIVANGSTAADFWGTKNPGSITECYSPHGV